VILQQTVAPEQIKKLLETGKTDLLTGFVSNKTHRKFSAYLALQKGGKVGFEFEEREPKAAGAKSRTRAVRKTAVAAEEKAAPVKRRTRTVKKTSES
jgi:DNA topoisomerase-3